MEGGEAWWGGGADTGGAVEGTRMGRWCVGLAGGDNEEEAAGMGWGREDDGGMETADAEGGRLVGAEGRSRGGTDGCEVETAMAADEAGPVESGASGGADVGEVEMRLLTQSEVGGGGEDGGCCEEGRALDTEMEGGRAVRGGWADEAGGFCGGG